MARTTIAAQQIQNTYYPATPLGATTADLILTATDDPTDRETPIVDGKTLLLAVNSNASTARTITITSAPDSQNRKGDITTYSIAGGKTALFGPFKTAGWATSGKLPIDISNAELRLAVLQLP